MFVCFFKQKTAYEIRISDWSSDVCSSDLPDRTARKQFPDRMTMGHFPPLDAYSRDAVSHRLGTLLTLSEDERQMIRRMQTEPRQITPLTDIIEEGQCYERQIGRAHV